MRPRWWIAGSVAVVVIVAGGIGIASAMSAAASTPDYRTATVDRGSVTQTLLLSGTVSRVNERTAAFPVSGTVASVSVAVGDTVVAGQKLATLDPMSLQANLLAAQATLARDQATLAADESGSASGSSGSGSSGSGSSGSGSSGSGSSGSASAASGSTGARSANSVRGAATTGRSGSTADAQAQLKRADASLTQIQHDLAQANALCEPVTGSQSASTPGGKGQGGSRGGSGPTVKGAVYLEDPAPTNSPSPTDAPTATPTPSPSTTPTPSPTPSAGTGATGATPTQIAACERALASIAQALQVTEQQVSGIAHLLTSGGTAASESGSGSGASSSGASSSAASGSGASSSAASGSGTSGSRGSSSDSGATSTAARTASDQAAIVQDEAAVTQAKADVKDAVLTAPIAGTVASVGLVAGTDASTSQGVTIVGPGAAAVSVEIPLADMRLTHAGLAARVTPAGGASSLSAKVQSVQLLPSSSSSTTTFPATVIVADPPTALASGSSATVSIVTATAQDAVRVPASALSGRSGQSGSVTVLSGTETTRTAVQVGAVGGGWVQITSGLKTGQQVVLADAGEALPTNTTGLGGLGGGFRGGGGGGGFSGGTRGGAGG